MNAIDLTTGETRIRQILEQQGQSGHAAARLLTRLSRTGVPIMPLFGAAILALIGGLFEDSMTPFHSMVYFLAIVLTYQSSIEFGVAGGLVGAAGSMAMLFLGSIFRTSADLAGFAREMPFDALLFGALAILPGLAIALERGRCAGAERRAAELTAQLAKLQVKHKEVCQVQAAATSAASDPRRVVREGMAIVNLARDILNAGPKSEDRARALLTALETAVSPASAMLFTRAAPGSPLALRDLKPRRPMPIVPPIEPDHPLAKAAASPDSVMLLEPPIVLVPSLPALHLAMGVSDPSGPGPVIALALGDPAGAPEVSALASSMLRMASKDRRAGGGGV